MALDKQKILHELGSVVNQLQSADCGCMGKLFSPNSGQSNPNGSMAGQCSGGMRSCCGHSHGYHGHNAPCAGEPCSGGPSPRHCMGSCNPTRLYADTYSFLNQNMMQPVVNEVYQDLKSISPANTIMNDPKAAQMGLSGANPNQGNPMAQNSMMGNSTGNPNPMAGGPMGNENPAQTNMSHHHGPHLHFGNGQMNNPQFNDLIKQPGMSPIEPGAGQMQYGANQMGQGMGQTGQGMGQAGRGMGQMGQEMGQMGQGMGQMGQGMGQMGQGIGQMGQGMGETGQNEMGASRGMMSGMGPQIMQMMMSSAAKNNSMFTPGQGQIQPASSPGDNAPQSQGMSQPNMAGDMNQRQLQPGHMHSSQGYMGMNNNLQPEMQQSRPQPIQQSPQYTQQMNAFPAATSNTQSNEMSGNMRQMGNVNPMPQQNVNSSPYGQHSAGMAKFSEMFPGVMKADLGFDPMAIAFQMNPANQQKSAMNKMEDMMMNNSQGINKMANLIPGSQEPQPTNRAPSNQVYNQQNIAPATQQYQLGANAGAVPTQNNQIPQQQVYAVSATPSMNQQRMLQQQPATNTGAVPSQNQIPQQQVYTAITGAPTMNQQQPMTNQQEIYDQTQPPQYQQSLYKMVDPNAEANRAPAENERTLDRDAYKPPTYAPTKEMMYKEPIFPADTSRNLLQSHHFAKHRAYEYNTLGQPVEKRYEMSDYHNAIPPLPQTLSPSPTRYSSSPTRYSNVKATVSKTALMGNKPVGKTPSRSQLQHIYNQYKGSQSYTQQEARPYNSISYSEGKINIPRESPHQEPKEYKPPIERVAGDSAANHPKSPVPIRNAPIMEQIGDVAGKSPAGDYAMIPMKNTKLRNGLQDQVFTSPPQSAKWTFHGSTPPPAIGGYRRWR